MPNQDLKSKWITQKGATLLERLKILLAFELNHTPPNHEALEIAVQESVNKREKPEDIHQDAK